MTAKKDPKPRTRRQVRTMLAGIAMGQLTRTEKKELVCTLVGHSRIVDTFFGEVTCGRCEKKIGDTLAGSFDLGDKVIVGHDCKECRKNFAALTWRDKMLAKNPFPKKKEAA